MQVPLLDLKAQYAPLKEETMKAVSEVFDSQYFIMGPKVREFEEAMEAYTGAKHALGIVIHCHYLFRNNSGFRVFCES